MLIPGAEPFLFPGGSTGCLLVHGFTATPNVMRWLGEHLAREGHTVMGIRLPGHATTPFDMVQTRWQDWAAAMYDAWHMMQNMTRRVFLLGHSTGGALSLLLAANRPVAGVVGMSTLTRIPPDPRMRPLRYLPLAVRLYLLRAYSRVRPLVAKGPPDWVDQQALQSYITYPDTPLRAVSELRTLLLRVRASLDQVRAPVLLIHSKNDSYIPYQDSEYIYNSLGSREKDLLLVENSGHILPMDGERERVFEAASRFIQQTITS